MNPAYYNELDPYAAQWLRNLIKAGHIPAGDVDERDIKEVTSDDLRGYAQCHFFAGIGGWAYAARLAGWPDGKPIWTGSCPCQPFSVAGKRRGTGDERHLWPEFKRLIAERKPSIVFGEQVASSDGRKWLNGVRVDLEMVGYAVGAADMCAASQGAPHIRQRLFWVADSNGWIASDGDIQRGRQHRQQQEDSCSISGLANTTAQGAWGRRILGPKEGIGEVGERAPNQSSGCGEASGLGYTERSGLQRDTRRGAVQQLEDANTWSDFDVVHCADGKSRRIESGTFPLAHGVPNRVGRLRAYGNAIVPQVAAEIIRAMM